MRWISLAGALFIGGCVDAAPAIPLAEPDTPPTLNKSEEWTWHAGERANFIGECEKGLVDRRLKRPTCACVADLWPNHVSRPEMARMAEPRPRFELTLFDFNKVHPQVWPLIQICRWRTTHGTV